MTNEYFFGATLSATNKSETWDLESKEDYPRNTKLLIRQVLLGPEAAANELNVVQVETMSLLARVEIPIAVLKVGESRHARVDLEFFDAPVTFTLTQGSGPVHLIGQTLVGAFAEEEFEDMEEMEEEMLDEEEGDNSHEFKEEENKRKASASEKRKNNEEEDDDDGKPKGKKAKLSNNAKGKAPSPKKNTKK